MSVVHIDSFLGALGDIPPTQQGDDAVVLAVLRLAPRFSVFEVTPKLGKTLERLKRARHIAFTDTDAYPWQRVIVDPPPPVRPVTRVLAFAAVASEDLRPHDPDRFPNHWSTSDE